MSKFTTESRNLRAQRPQCFLSRNEILIGSIGVLAAAVLLPIGGCTVGKANSAFITLKNGNRSMNTLTAADHIDFNPAPVVPLASQRPARLVVDSPLPEQLASGYVVVRYRAENVRIMPVYGPSALDILPRIGHLHITVDDLPWHWLDASGEPISINGLPRGRHKLLVELESPTHKVIDSATIYFEIPER
jgi:hypothetical protein